MHPELLIKETVKSIVKSLYNHVLDDVLIEHPENEEFGDYATNVSMVLAKNLKQSPMVIAKSICYEIEQSDLSITYEGAKIKIFSSISIASPGFINLVLSVDWLNYVLRKFLDASYHYGVGEMLEKKRIALEHSNVNPNKAAHIGHLRNACIGQFIERIYEYLGFDVEVQYYCNDLGVQVTTSLLGVEKIKDVDPSKYDKYDHYMWDVYSKFSTLLEEDLGLKKELTDTMIKLEDRTSTEAVKQKVLANRVLKDNLETFSKLGFDYDVIIYESDIAETKLWEKTFDLLKKNENFYFSDEGISKGCWLVKLSEKQSNIVIKDNKEKEMGIEEDKIIVRSNGVATYTGKDIAYHMWKYGLLGTDFYYTIFNTTTQKKPLYVTSSKMEDALKDITFSNVDRVFDVIDMKQTYAINVVKESLKFLGYEEESQSMKHVNYGFVYLSSDTAKQLGIDTSDGKSRYGMSGRRGWGIKIDDFINMVDDSLVKVHGSFEVLADVRNGAIKFEMLKYNTFQDLVFDLSSALNIKGFSGPYIQYTYARGHSVLEKAGYIFDVTKDYPAVNRVIDQKELALLRTLYRFGEVIERSACEFAPNVLCMFLFELCQKFNVFYNDLPIINASDDAAKKYRLLLTLSVSNVLSHGLHLLGIAYPKKI